MSVAVENKIFYSKVLLFGEYGIIKNSMGLAMPYPLFGGHLTFWESGVEQESGGVAINSELKAFVQYLKDLKSKNKLLCDLELDLLGFDVDQGLYFKSTIPQGYGVGSSGALCAAVFDRYGKIKDSKLKHENYLRKVFAQMESHFHGASSGIDPLISYLNCSVLIKDMNNLEKVYISEDKKKDNAGGIFLLNTARARRTEPLVNLFLEKCSTKPFGQLCDNVLRPIINDCISSFLEKDSKRLFKKFKKLSKFQYKYFTPMIPKLFINQWADGLATNDYYLKLCGAGGGGFLMGLTRDFELAKKQLGDHEIRPLFYI